MIRLSRLIVDKPIILAKRPGGPERAWVYDPEHCPACFEGDRSGYPCGVCRGTGILFEDGYINEDQLKALQLARVGHEHELDEFAEMLTSFYLDELMNRGETE